MTPATASTSGAFRVNAVPAEHFTDPKREVSWEERDKGSTPQPLAVVSDDAGVKYVYIDGYVKVDGDGNGVFVKEPLSPRTKLEPGAFKYLEERWDLLTESGVRSAEQLHIAGFFGDVAQAIATVDKEALVAISSSQSEYALTHPGDKAQRQAIRLHNLAFPENQIADPDQVLADFIKWGPGLGASAAVGGVPSRVLKQLQSLEKVKELSRYAIAAGAASGVAADATLQAIDNLEWEASGGAYGRHGIDPIQLGLSGVLGAGLPRVFAGVRAIAPKVAAVLGSWKNAIADAWADLRAGASSAANSAGAAPVVRANKVSGDAARDFIAAREGGVIEQNFRVTGGLRRVDVLKEGNEIVAIESKVGRTSLDSRTRPELARDVEMLRSGQVDRVVWEFSESAKTGRVGPTPALQQKLEKFGIEIRYSGQRFLAVSDYE